MNDFVRDAWQKGESGGGSGTSSTSTGTAGISGQDGDGRKYNPNYMNLDSPPPNPPPKFERDEQDPNLDAPNLTGANKKKKKRKGKRDLRRGGFLSSLKIDRGSSMGGTNKKNPYSIGGM